VGYKYCGEFLYRLAGGYIQTWKCATSLPSNFKFIKKIKTKNSCKTLYTHSIICPHHEFGEGYSTSWGPAIVSIMGVNDIRSEREKRKKRVVMD